MKFFLSVSMLFLITFSALSQKVEVQIIKNESVALSVWQILDEQYQVVISGSDYSGNDSVSFSLNANRKYYLKISVYEVYNPNNILYSLQINDEPVLNVKSDLIADHLFPFFTGIRTRAVKITGGTSAPISDFPWQVYVIAGNYRCGGSIISGKWVVTAAHCALNNLGNPIPAADMAVKVGANNPSSSLDGKKYLVSEVIVHEGYDSQTDENDIALLGIKDSINFPNALPIKLVSASDVAEGAIAPGVMVWITGWGLTKVNPDVLPTSLQKVELPIVSNATAALVWGTIPSTDIMAGYRDGNKDACSGDSGGPLVVSVSGESKLAGIISWGSGNCNTYGGYTKVSLFESWIRTKTGIAKLYMPSSPVGDTVVCLGTASGQYSIVNQPSATAYEWKLFPAGAGVISGNTTNSSVLWDIKTTGSVAVMVRVTINNIVSDWSKLKVNIVRNTRLSSQSTDSTLCAFQPISIGVAAEGYKLSYKWSQNNNPVQTGTSNKLVYSSILTSNAGNYKCQITGSCGTVFSNSINLTVYPITSISHISPDFQVPFGNDITLEVQADGHNLLYQWEKDGISLVNANTALLTLPHVNATDIGLYHVLVKGICGKEARDSVYVYVKKDINPDATEVFVWPTFTNSVFNVAMHNDTPYGIQIYSTTGRIVRELTNCRYQTSIDISMLPNGVYIVIVSHENFRKSIKIIKE